MGFYCIEDGVFSNMKSSRLVPVPRFFPTLLKAFSNGPQGLLSSERPSTLRHRLNRRQRTQSPAYERAALLWHGSLGGASNVCVANCHSQRHPQCDAVAWVPLSMEHVCCPSPSRKDGYDASPTRACGLVDPDV
jgi:hypothetical protein